MHIDYAKEVLQYNREQSVKHNWKCNVEAFTITAFIKEKEFIKLAKEKGSQKTIDIIQTIEDNSYNKYFKVTDKMSYSIALDLLSKLSIDEIIECFKK